MKILVAHFKYAKYVFWHKWYVLRACWNRGLILQGIVHDWTKFTPSEWFPYVNRFYLSDYNHQKEGYFHEPNGSAFDYAWLYHQRRNPHHWQYWVLVQDDEPTLILDMPYKYLLEMVCDWYGAGMAQGKPDIKAWYLKNKDRIMLSDKTRFFVERELDTL
jgi:hypothetical protein